MHMQSSLIAAQSPDPVPPLRRHGDQDLAAFLVSSGRISPHDLRRALAQMTISRAGLMAALSGLGVLTEPQIAAALAEFHRVSAIDPAADPPDARLVDRIGAARCITLRLLPWKRIGGVTLIGCADPVHFARHRAMLEGVFGPVSLVLAGEAALTAAIAAARPAELRRMAAG